MPTHIILTIGRDLMVSKPIAHPSPKSDYFMYGIAGVRNSFPVDEDGKHVDMRVLKFVWKGEYYNVGDIRCRKFVLDPTCLKEC